MSAHSSASSQSDHMTQLVVTTRAGAERIVSAKGGQSLMQALRDLGFDDILAICGGVCACATCHVYVDSSHLERLPPMGQDEAALLESSEWRTPESRLSCQISCDDIPADMQVRIAPED
jgi:2Fe-2S ferredoxin